MNTSFPIGSIRCIKVHGIKVDIPISSQTTFPHIIFTQKYTSSSHSMSWIIWNLIWSICELWMVYHSPLIIKPIKSNYYKWIYIRRLVKPTVIAWACQEGLSPRWVQLPRLQISSKGALWRYLVTNITGIKPFSESMSKQLISGLKVCFWAPHLQDSSDLWCADGIVRMRMQIVWISDDA